MSMLGPAGFEDVRMPLKADYDSRNPLNQSVAAEDHLVDARAWIVATKTNQINYLK